MGYPTYELDLARGHAYEQTETMARAIVAALRLGQGALVVGHAGAGKTVAADRASIAFSEDIDSALYLYWADWLREIRQGFDSGVPAKGEAYQIDRACEPDLLLIDDLGVEKHSEWGESVLHSVLRRRALERQDRTIITSNLQMESKYQGASLLSVYGPRIHSRLKAYALIQVPDGTPDWRGLKPAVRTNVKSIRQAGQ